MQRSTYLSVLVTSLLVCYSGVSRAQTAPADYQPSYFELVLPDLNQTIGSGNAVADLPADKLSRLTIQLVGAADKNLAYGDVQVRINGKGVGNIFDSGSTTRGKYLALDARALMRRHDPIFDPQQNSIEVYGRDRRGRDYYQNWVLRNGSGAGNSYFTYVSQMSPGDETGVPPDLNLEQPTTPVAFADGTHNVSVRVKGTASAAAGIATLTANGKPLAIGAGGVFEGAVGVSRGDSAVVIEAVDNKANRRSITIPVMYPAAAETRVALSGDKYAVVVGISRYGQSAGAPSPIPAAATDARFVASALEARGFPGSNIRLLVDGDATVEQLRTALGDFAAKAKPEDLLVIFLSTHAVHDPTAPEKIYLTGVDSQRQSLGSTAIEVSDLQLLLRRSLRSKHVLLFFDVEHPLTPDWAFSGKPVVNAHFLTLFNALDGPAVLVSGAAGQEAEDHPASGTTRGLFTTALVDGISGKADVNHDGVLTPRELCVYVSESVRRASGGQQDPQFRVSEETAEQAVLGTKR